MIDEILAFWFGTKKASGRAADGKAALWWGKSEDTDREIRQRFEPVYEQITHGGHQDWQKTPHGALAYIIVLDQFSRNMFRDTPKMYAADHLAVAAVKAGLDAGYDRELVCDECSFLYMPLMHSEALVDQEHCVQLFADLCERVPDSERKDFENSYDFAIQHRDIVARFGRFPHRNEILGRESTPEELTFLKEPGSSF